MAALYEPARRRAAVTHRAPVRVRPRRARRGTPRRVAARRRYRRAVTTPEVHLFLPQMRLSMPALVERARAAEAAGFTGMAGMDHLVPPLAEDQPMFEAMITNAWLAAATGRLVVGSLVLCDSFRHPSVLAREAVTLDHASDGRFELGIGWGSVVREFEMFGLGAPEARARLGRLRET